MIRTATHTMSLSTLAVGIGLAVGTQAHAQAVGTACADLVAQSFPNTAIAAAAPVAAGAFESPAPAFGGPPPDYSSLPAFCRVTGSIRPTDDSDIRFELWLPAAASWNGRFMQTGNGGAAGSIVVTSLPDPLSRGYAVANTDTGHQGGGGEFSWAIGHSEKLVDYQYRAVHELTVVGKAITAAHYGRSPDESYWLGCSTGGRQGLKEAQRYPDDYDAIVAGAPANNWAPLMGLATFIQSNLGANGLGADKLGLLKESAIAACDADDGVTDRVISSPSQCGFDPASLQCEAGATGVTGGSDGAGAAGAAGADGGAGTSGGQGTAGEPARCLSPTEVTAARSIYSGLVTSNGEVLMPGTGVGSEPLWGAYAAGPFTIGTNWFRQVVLNDPDWDPAEFDTDTHVALAEQQDRGAAKAMDPDISDFVGRGGKLLLYHGTTDGLIPYGNTVNYYESVVARLGQTAVDDSVRLFLVPGMDHCSGGEGAFAVDWLGALEQWVETDAAPDQLPGAHPANVPGPPGAPAQPPRPFTRPICAYPEVATYANIGDPNDAASFDCALP